MKDLNDICVTEEQNKIYVTEEDISDLKFEIPHPDQKYLSFGLLLGMLNYIEDLRNNGFVFDETTNTGMDLKRILNRVIVTTGYYENQTLAYIMENDISYLLDTCNVKDVEK